MLWIPVTLLSAIAEAALTIERKRVVTSATPFQLALIQGGISALVFGLLLPVTWRAHVSAFVWTLIVIRSILDAFAAVLMFIAIECDEASRIMPITALAPLFIVGLEFAWTGRAPSTRGLIGIAILTVGVFALLRGTKKESGHRVTPGMVPIFGVTLCWSLSSTIHGIVTPQIGPLLYLGLSQTLIFFLTLFYGIVCGKTTTKQLRFLPIRQNIGLGLLASIAPALQMFAQSLMLASYVVALRRLSLVFAMVGSALVLKEKIARRIFPTLLLCFGAAMIILFG